MAFSFFAGILITAISVSASETDHLCIEVAPVSKGNPDLISPFDDMNIGDHITCICIKNNP
jgi:hypothetical protein